MSLEGRVSPAGKRRSSAKFQRPGGERLGRGKGELSLAGSESASGRAKLEGPRRALSPGPGADGGRRRGSYPPSE